MIVLLMLMLIFHSTAGFIHLIVGVGVGNWTLIYNGTVGMTLVVLLAKTFL